MKECKECYSLHKRITPLLNARECLTNHEQYICGTCGRCSCISKTEKGGLQRWNFPFKSLQIAKLYLRTAEISTRTNCGIYEIVGSNGRVSYKLFPQHIDFVLYLQKKKDKTCLHMQPIYQNEKFTPSPTAEIRKLETSEIESYLHEQQVDK